MFSFGLSDTFKSPIKQVNGSETVTENEDDIQIIDV